jgi:hypothetical protein
MRVTTSGEAEKRRPRCVLMSLPCDRTRERIRAFLINSELQGIAIPRQGRSIGRCMRSGAPALHERRFACIARNGLSRHGKSNPPLPDRPGERNRL